jgi:hypothetical protein
MVVIGAAADLYVNEVTVKTLTGRDAEWGGATYSAGQTVTCLVVEQTRIVRAPDGSEVVSGTQIYADLTSGALLQPGSVVELPVAGFRPAGSSTTVITLDAISVGDPAVDGVVALCE